MLGLVARRLPHPQRSRRWVHRAVVALTVLTAMAVFLVGGGLAYLNWRVAQVPRVEGLGSVLSDPVSSNVPVNILLVGSDTRSDIPTSEHHKFGDDTDVEGQRSDTMMIVHADPQKGQLSVLSIPRDLWVTLADLGTPDRINQAFDGGPSRLIRTIQSEIGIQINHYAEVDFVGFRSVVKAVGGVPVYVPRPARDTITGLRIESEGCTLLDGEQALAYVRSRRYQELVNGRWRTDPTSDFGRIKRQQGFMRHTLRRALAKGARNPIVLDRLIGAAVKTVKLDDQFSTRDLARLARRFRSLPPEAVRTYVLPSTSATINRNDVLLLDKGRANDVINRFNGFPPGPPMTPSRVRMRVSSAVPGVDVDADDLADRFRALGFDLGPSETLPTDGTLSTDDAATNGTLMLTTDTALSTETTLTTGTALTTGTTQAEARRRSRRNRTTGTAAPAPTGDVTVIRHRPDSMDKGIYVAGFFIGGASLVEDDSLDGVDVEIVPGRNYVGTRERNIGFVGPTFADNDGAGAHACP